MVARSYASGFEPRFWRDPSAILARSQWPFQGRHRRNQTVERLWLRLRAALPVAPKKERESLGNLGRSKAVVERGFTYGK